MKENYWKHYRQRIGIETPLRPDLATLAALQQKHIAAIPFENLNPLLGLPVSLSEEVLYDKLIRQHRGGYCFEQNLFFQTVLRTLGFEPRGLLGRAGAAENSVGRTHLILLVNVGGSDYIVDVGYGGLVPMVPLLFHTGLVQQTPRGNYRISTLGDEFRLEINLLGQWKRLYDFGLQHQIREDFEVANWYTATSPSSLFTQRLVAALSEGAGAYTLNGQQFTEYKVGAEPVKTLLPSLDAVKQVLETKFKINLSGLPHLERLMNG